MEAEKTLNDLKVGDPVWTIADGETNIKEISTEATYCFVTTAGNSYTIKGKECKGEKNPSLFLSNPFEKTDHFEARFMMVSQDNIFWEKRYVLGIVHFQKKLFLALKWADTVERVQKITLTADKINNWNFAKEIPEIQKFTKLEIAEILKIDVNEFEII